MIAPAGFAIGSLKAFLPGRYQGSMAKGDQVKPSNQRLRSILFLITSKKYDAIPPLNKNAKPELFAGFAIGSLKILFVWGTNSATSINLQIIAALEY